MTDQSLSGLSTGLSESHSVGEVDGCDGEGGEILRGLFGVSVVGRSNYVSTPLSPDHLVV